jgi:hypothetical protein
VTVDSFRRWYRELIAKTYTAHRKSRSRIDKDLEALIIKMALENVVLMVNFSTGEW